MENTTVAAANDALRYPVGKFEKPTMITPEQRAEFIQIIADLPKNIAQAVEGLSDEQLEAPYRPDGWTLRQTVHHVADSHMNSLTRFKLALTEDNPTIRPYFEDRWALLADNLLPVEVSLRIIEGIHARLVAVLESLTDEDFQKPLIHPESGAWTIEEFLALYAWHSRHHTAHITRTRERSGW
jgi:uncharacterized damage-inducible protein DinB